MAKEWEATMEMPTSTVRELDKQRVSRVACDGDDDDEKGVKRMREMRTTTREKEEKEIWTHTVMTPGTWVFPDFPTRKFE